MRKRSVPPSVHRDGVEQPRRSLQQSGSVRSGRAAVQAGTGRPEKANGPDDPEATILMNNLADTYINRHRYADAERLLKRSIAVTEKAFGPDHPDVAQALNNLAALNARRGRNADAERLYKRSVATFEKTLGPNHPDLADVLQNLAGLYKDQGRYADAAQVLKRSMAIRVKSGSAPI